MSHQNNFIYFNIYNYNFCGQSWTKLNFDLKYTDQICTVFVPIDCGAVGGRGYGDNT